MYDFIKKNFFKNFFFQYLKPSTHVFPLIKLFYQSRWELKNGILLYTKNTLIENEFCLHRTANFWKKQNGYLSLNNINTSTSPDDSFNPIRTRKKTHNPDFQAQSNPLQLQPPTYKRILRHSKNCARTAFH